MLPIKLPIVFSLGLAVFSTTAQADLNIFTCEPEWASLATELGGDHIVVESATQGLQDPHYIQARPSLISRMRKADLVICTGAQLEIGWLPMLLSKANNPRVLPGKPGFLEASTLVPKLDIPASVDRSQGDMHAGGNPHIQGSPKNIALVATGMAERLSALDPANAEVYRAGLESFQQRWSEAMVRWEAMAQALHGKTLVAHHRSFTYMEDWLQLKELATLEPLSGIPPTSAHLADLLEMLGSDGTGAAFIIHEAYQSPKASDWLSEKTGIPAVLLPTTVGGTDEATDLFTLFDDIINRLLGARP